MVSTASEAPQLIINLAVTSNIVIILIALVFLVYWFKTKQTESASTQSAVVQTVNSVDVENNNQINPAHLSVLYTVSLISCGMFIYTGWGVFIAVPVSLVFSIFYLVVFTKVLKKSNTTPLAVYTVTLTLVFAYISILFNAGIISDASYIIYLAPSILQVPSFGFESMFDKLYVVSFLYLVLSVPVNIFLIKNGARKILLLLMPLVGILLIMVHWGVVWEQLPELKAQVYTEQQNEKQKEQANTEAVYSFDWSKINENTFKNRVYSIFTPPTPSSETPTNQCPYAMGMIEQNLAEGEGFNINCLNDSLKPIGQVPITKTEILGINIPNVSNTFKKGDVVAVVVDLENPSMVRIHADGNAAKDCPCRMAPYDYSGINEHVSTGTSTRIYEYSVVQMQVTDKKRTVMVLYPINIDGLTDIGIKLSQFSNNPNAPVTLKEVVVLSPTKLAPDPEWLKKWLKEPNPFLGKK